MHVQLTNKIKVTKVITILQGHLSEMSHSVINLN